MDFIQFILVILKDWFDRMREIMTFIRETFLPSENTKQLFDDFIGF